jgi:hypothetical protein
VTQASLSGLAAAEKEYLAHQIAALRISLAKKDAEVARLAGEGGRGWASDVMTRDVRFCCFTSFLAVTEQVVPFLCSAVKLALRFVVISSLDKLCLGAVCFVDAAGALAEAVAQCQGPAAASAPASRSQLLSAGAAATVLQAQAQQQASGQEHLAAGIIELQRAYSSSSITGSRSGSQLPLSHSATAAARMAREASMKAAAAAAHGFAVQHPDGPDTLPGSAGDSWSGQRSHQQQLAGAAEQEQEEEHALLSLNYAAASAQLASALATARQVLKDLVLGSSPSPQQQAGLDAELAGLTLEEALSEVVYQVQDKLAVAAAVAEAAQAQAQAAASAVAAEQAQDGDQVGCCCNTLGSAVALLVFPCVTGAVTSSIEA